MNPPTPTRVAIWFLACCAFVGCQKVQIREPRLDPEPVATADSLATPVESFQPDTLVAESELGPTVAAHRIRLGVLAPFSGRYGNYGRAYLDGAQLAIDAFAHAERVYAEALPGDTKGAPTAALAALRRLAHEEGAVCIVGGMLNLPTWVAAVEANCAQVPLVSNVATEVGINEVGPWVFHEVASQQRAAVAAAEQAAFELRRFRIAVLYPNEGEGRALASTFSSRVGELGGRIVASESFAHGTMDFTSVVRRIRAANPELLYVPVDPDQVMLIAPTLAFHGVDAVLIGREDWNSEQLMASIGLDLEGALIPEATHASQPGELDRFDSAYLDKYGERPSSIAVAGYMATQRVLEVVATLPSVDRATLRDALDVRAAHDEQRPMGFRFLVVRDGEARPYAAP